MYKKEALNFGISLTKRVKGKNVKRGKYELQSAIQKAKIMELKKLLKLCSQLLHIHNSARKTPPRPASRKTCLLYTSDAADE